MKRIFLISVILFVFTTGFSQVGNFTTINLSQYISVKKLTVAPNYPAVGFVRFYSLNDSLHFMNHDKDWNLGVVPYTIEQIDSLLNLKADKDSLAYYLLKTDTVYFLHQSDLSGIRDTLILHRDSLANAYILANSKLDTTKATYAIRTAWTAAYNDKINSASFSKDTGVLTLTQQDAGTVTTSMDGRYSQISSDVSSKLGSAAYADISAFLRSGINYQKYLSVDGENNIVVGFTLTSSAKVYYNGNFLSPGRWSGLGTNKITLSLDTRKYDELIINN